MTPEELLQALLDSRSRSSIAESNDRTDSTRIRVLRTLRDEANSPAELAEQIGISRQTAYRALDPCCEAGLIRRNVTGYRLTCSGGALLRTYDAICEEIEQAALVQLARSAHKRWVLKTLSKTPTDKAALAGAAGQTDSPSRTTVHRIIDIFVTAGYVAEDAGTYELTKAGYHLLAAYTEVRSTVEQILDKRAFLRWLPATLDSFPVEALRESTVIHNTLDQPHRVLDAFVSAADPNLDTFRGIGSIRSSTLDEVYRPIVRGETVATVIFTDDILYHRHRDAEFIDFVAQTDYGAYLSQGCITEDSQLLFVPDAPSVQLAIYDGQRVIVAPAPSTGIPEVDASAIDSTDPRIVDWASEFFNQQRLESRSPLETFRDQIRKRDSAQQDV